MSRLRKYRTNILFPRASFIGGIGCIFNIGGKYFEFNYSLSAEEADRLAIENDWYVVGYDIRQATSKEKGRSKVEEPIELQD